MVEYRLAKARVAGSNPVSRVYNNRKILKKQGFSGFCHIITEDHRRRWEAPMGNMRENNGIERTWIWTILLVLYVGFIFCNSLTPADESSRQSGGVLRMILGMVQGMGLEGSWITEHLVRKTAHFVEYTGLGILLGITLRQYPAGRMMRRVLQCWIGVMIPLVDETLQLFTEGRSGQISDVWLDTAGVFTGFLVIGGMYWLLGRKGKTQR